MPFEIMSDNSSDSDDGIFFQDRPSSANFQERLMQAKSSTEFDPMDKETVSMASSLQKERKKERETLTDAIIR